MHLGTHERRKFAVFFWFSGSVTLSTCVFPTKDVRCFLVCPIVDGSEIRRSPVDMANISIIYRVLYIPSGWPWDFWTINSIKMDRSLGLVIFGPEVLGYFSTHHTGGGSKKVWWPEGQRPYQAMVEKGYRTQTLLKGPEAFKCVQPYARWLFDVICGICQWSAPIW